MYSYDKKEKKSSVSCNSTVLCETLGSIRYMFTDKTGTLTKNELILRSLCIGDQMYSLLNRIIMIQD